VTHGQITYVAVTHTANCFLPITTRPPYIKM